MKRGQITKKLIPGHIAQLELWQLCNEERINAMRPDFRNWVYSQLLEIQQMIYSQDYHFAVQSRISHMVSTMKRMESGEITSVSADGMSFTLAQKCD